MLLDDFTYNHIYIDCCQNENIGQEYDGKTGYIFTISNISGTAPHSNKRFTLTLDCYWSDLVSL